MDIVAEVKANPHLSVRQSNQLIEKHKASIHEMENTVAAAAKAGERCTNHR
ncbi:hypothetical protein DFAR_3630008 [Desulfarculales bacterium]